MGKKIIPCYVSACVEFDVFFLWKSFLPFAVVVCFEDGRVVSNFIMQALAGEDITIYGDGGQTRSFCFVDDLVEGLIRLMNNETEVSNTGATTTVPSQRTLECFCRNGIVCRTVQHIALHGIAAKSFFFRSKVFILLF